MAIQDNKGYLRGKVGPVVYRSSDGVRIVQSVPRKFEQALVTQLNGHEFGLASNLASIMRQVLASTVDCVDGKIMYRLTGTVRNCLHQTDKAIGDRDLHDANLEAFKGFELNINAPFEKTLKKHPALKVTETGEIIFNLNLDNPEKDLVLLGKEKEVNAVIKVTSIAFNFRKEEIQLIDHVEFRISRGKATELSWLSDKNLPAGSFLLVVLSLHYSKQGWMGNQQSVIDLEYTSSGIMDAFHVTDKMIDKGDEDHFIPTHALPTPMPNKMMKKLRKMQDLKKKYK
jgi:hypothetical protein